MHRMVLQTGNSQCSVGYGETGLPTSQGANYTVAVVYVSTQCLAHDVTHYTYHCFALRAYNQ